MTKKEIIFLAIGAVAIVVVFSISTILAVKFMDKSPQKKAKYGGSTVVTFQINHAVALCNQEIKNRFKDTLLSVSFKDLSNRYNQVKNIYLLFANVQIKKEVGFKDLHISCEVSGRSYDITSFHVDT